MIFPKKAFVKAEPAQQGIDPRAVSAMVSDILSSEKDIHSLLIVRNGYLVSENYFAPYTAEKDHSMFSCSKTFTSMLIGIAQEKGLLSVEDQVASFFPDKLPQEPSENLLAMKIKHLLSMSTGNDQDTFGYMRRGGSDWVKTFLSRPVEHEPGTFFRYNTGATYMLSAILTKLTGKTALELANEWYLHRIGVYGAQWDMSPEGISIGGSGLHITPRDMARFGLLLLNEGKWEDEQLIPAQYVLEAQKKHIDTTNHIDHPDWLGGYCWQMWRCSYLNAYRADGMGGQFIVVIPEKQTVVVFTSALGADIVYPMDIVGKYLSDAFDRQDCPDTAEMPAMPQEYDAPEDAGIPYGKTIEFAEPLLGMIRSLSIEHNAIKVSTELGQIKVCYGWGTPRLSDGAYAMPYQPTQGRISVMAKIEGNEVLFRLNVYGGPETIYFTARFDGDKVCGSVRATSFTPESTFEGTIR